MHELSSRRGAMLTLGIGLAGLATAAEAAEAPALLAPGAKGVRELAARLARAPRRRDFKTVPMVLDHPDQWDNAALGEVIGYRAGPKQVWDNTDLASPWLNLMRNSMNAQIFSFRHADFLAVSATHGLAHLALFDQAVWEKYQLSKLTGGKFASNTLLPASPAAGADPKDFEAEAGAFSSHDNSVTALMRRGAVFLACHNTTWEIAERLIAAGVNPDKLSHEQLAADLTNHVVPGAVLTPGIVGTLVELQGAGFHYAK
jgi:hypothetical protein